ncbi:MAG: S9 family peptidase [Proteobacteria bacterium]|nr:S9 family peptidase [Pseudomonadota bacterium]
MRPIRRYRFLPVLAALLLAPLGAAVGRPLAPADFYRFEDVSDLAIARDGTRVAWLVNRFDKASDESRSDVWAADWDGRRLRQISHGASAHKPRFTPDGRVGFLAARAEGAPTQLWVAGRNGAAARQVSHVPGEITDYAWSPDGRHAVLVVRPHGDTRFETVARPRPWVMDGYQFKSDEHGYLEAGMRPRLCLLDVGNGRCERLAEDATGAQSAPAFSPDGSQIAFVSDDLESPQGAGRDEIRLVGARAGATSHLLLTTDSPNHQRLLWSPDGRRIAFLKGNELKYYAYIQDQLALVTISSGEVRPLTASLDRAVISPHFSSDGSAIEFAVEDDGRQYPARVALDSGRIERLGSASVVTELASAAGHVAVIVSDDHTPPQICALEGGALRVIGSYNRELMAELTLGSVEDVSFLSSDGTQIHGQMIKPPGFVAGRRYPTIVWIHGGPNGQDDHSLPLEGYSPQLDRQFFASHGYVALAINYRGSSGRGAAFARAITADWGHLEVEDLLAGVQYAVSAGVADPARLGIGGWSYGGLLTDYTIASDTRFRAGISGAGSGNQLAMWGVDQYVAQYQAELGPPWQKPALWSQVSYPMLKASRIRTPTLFLGGERDFNVPIVGSEQMYQSLRALEVPTQLVVYPGQTHIPDRPSFLVDRYQRYLEWMNRYLGPGTP